MVKKTNRRRMLKLIIIFRIYFSLFFLFTSNRTDIHWHMQSEHFVVLFITIQIQLNKDWISIFVLQTWKYSQIFTKKYTYNAHHSNIIIIWDWFWVDFCKTKYCMWQSLLFKVFKSTSREKRHRRKSLINNTKQKSDNGNPKRIWL